MNRIISRDLAVKIVTLPFKIEITKSDEIFIEIEVLAKHQERMRALLKIPRLLFDALFRARYRLFLVNINDF